MTQLLDDGTRRRAKVRAVASAIADEPRPVRRFQPPGPGRLQPVERRRRHAAAVPEPVGEGHDRRRLVAATVLLLQLCALAAVLWLPTFKVRTVDLSGNQLLSTSELLRVAGVPRQSIFTLDGDAIISRLQSRGWIRSVKVATELPGTVHITVTEWQPMVRVRRNGSDLVLAENGNSLPVSAAREGSTGAIPLLIDLRSDGMRSPVSPQLIQVLGDAATHFPGVFGVKVIAYQWDGDGRFSVWTSAGWRAILGHLDTALAVDAVAGQLAALSALRGALDLVHPSFGYVDLENAAAPAVGGRPGVSDAVTAALKGVTPPPSAAPTPAPVPLSAMASPAPQPTPAATPTAPQLHAPGNPPPGIP